MFLDLHSSYGSHVIAIHIIEWAPRGFLTENSITFIIRYDGDGINSERDRLFRLHSRTGIQDRQRESLALNHDFVRLQRCHLCVLRQCDNHTPDDTGYYQVGFDLFAGVSLSL